MTESWTSPTSNMSMWLLSRDICTWILLLLETWRCHRHRYTCNRWGSVLVRFRVGQSDIWLDPFGKSSKRGASRPSGALELTVCGACTCCRENCRGELHCFLLLTWHCLLQFLWFSCNQEFQPRSCQSLGCFQTHCRREETVVSFLFVVLQLQWSTKIEHVRSSPHFQFGFLPHTTWAALLRCKQT